MTRAKRNYHAGLAAEDCVLREYMNAGYQLLARRWRGQRGELDLVMSRDAEVVFIEVKKSRSFDAAAARIGSGQIERLFMTAAQYLGTCAQGQLTPSRFDVAVVDATGQVARLENALCA
ncbi:MAG: YraN family protein [Rhodobacteraceae bacterium]|nr:YraN family protein [Paracoccaceae bacterium]